MKRALATALIIGAAATGSTAAATAPPDSTTPPASTAAVELPDPDDIAAVHAYCTRDDIVAEFLRTRDLVVGDIYVGIAERVADDLEMTLDEFLRTILDGLYTADEETITIRGAWKEGEYGLTENGVLFGRVYDCLLDALDVPERVRTHIGQTRALDGLQTDSWSDYSAQWTYHPDDGMTITIWVDD